MLAITMLSHLGILLHENVDAEVDVYTLIQRSLRVRDVNCQVPRTRL